MIARNDAELAARWYAAWNAGDIKAIMALYDDEIEFSSPYVAALGFADDGIIEDKAQLRDYFFLALERAPDLRFVPESLCIGAGGHTLIYRNHRGERAAESHVFNAAGLIIRAEASYEAQS